MRIIYYSPHPTHDIVSEVGYATHQREVIQALKNLGHEVFPVIMGGTEISNLNHLSSENYQAPLIKKLLKRIMPRFIWTSLNNYKLRQHDVNAGKILEQKIIELKPDLLYERSEYLQDSGAKTARKFQLKYFLEVNAPFVEEMYEFEGYSLYHQLAHQIEAFKLETATKVFTVSSALKHFLTNRYQCEAEKIIVQPNCINQDKIHVEQQNANKVRMELGLGSCKTIGFVGSMFPYHGVDILVKAFSKILAKHPLTKLLIVGDGIVLEELKDLSRELSISNAVIFAGKIPHKDVFNYIELMDICVMAKSNWYGSPVKIFEYGLLKKPIIAPNNEPIRDVMVHLKDAYLVNQTQDDLEKALLTLLEDDKLSQQLAESFYHKVIEKFKWSEAAKLIIQTCELP